MAEWIGPKKEPTPRVVPGGSWTQRHPTRYGWHDDVRRVVDGLFRNFNGITINTYVDHPEGWTRKLGYDTQRRSLDVWGEGGRGDPIGHAKGVEVVRFMFNDPNPPHFNWVIWEGYIWVRRTPNSPDGFWKVWDDDGTGAHFDHPHITFMRKRFDP